MSSSERVGNKLHLFLKKKFEFKNKTKICFDNDL